MKKFKKIYLLFLIVFPVLLSAGICFAGGNLELSYPIIGGKTLTTDTDLPNFVNYIFTLALGVSGLLAFGVLIYSGMQYLTSTGNPGKIGDATDRIFSAFVGLLILLSAYIILKTINPDLVDIKMPNIQSSTINTTTK